MGYTYKNLLQTLNRLKSKSSISSEYERLIGLISNNNPNDLLSDYHYEEYLKLLDAEYSYIFKNNSSLSDEDFFYFHDRTLNEMYTNFHIFNSLQQAHKTDDKYTIIPLLNKKAYIAELGKILLGTELDLDNYLLLSGVFKEINTKIINNIRNSQINEYFGTPDFINDRCNSIEEAIEELYTASSHKEEISAIASSAPELIAEIKSIYAKGITKPEEYLKLSSSFQKLLKIENDLRPFAKIEWEEYFKNNNIYLIHVLSSSKIESNKMTKICTSIKTDDYNTIQYGHVGYEYGPNYDQIISVCPDDSGSWNVTKEKFISPQGIRITWQYGNKENMFYEFGKQSVLFLPEKVLEEGKENRYTEIIFMDYDHKIKPLKAFYTDEATEEEIKMITELAEKQNIPLEYINTELTNVTRKEM